MISPQLRRKVDDLWTMFWSGGITNPLTAIEQITYLLFLKHLELLDEKRVNQGKKSIYSVPWQGEPIIRQGKDVTPKDYDQCRWSVIRQNANYELLTDIVFPWLRILDTILLSTGNNANTMLEAGRMMEDAYFQLPREKTAMLTTAIQAIDDLFTLDTHSDLMGDIFEELLRGISTAGRNGQFRTPRHIIRFMVELVNPTPEDRIIDPAAGTGGYLFASIQHILKQAMLREAPEDLRLEWDGTPHRLAVHNANLLLRPENFTGYDNDRTMVRIGWMNMILHGIENPRIERRDSLGKGLNNSESEHYTVILANPPFTGNVDADDLHDRRFLQRGGKKALTSKSELLFLALFLDLLEPGGRAAVIVPEGVLFGSTTAHRELRRRLMFEHDLRAVISLPAGVFQPYTGVKTSILYFHKYLSNDGKQFSSGDVPHTEQVLFYEVLDDGYSLDAKRIALNQPGDLPDALDKVKQRSTSTRYVRPHTYIDRWRLVDKKTVKIFLDAEENRDFSGDLDHDYGLAELFPEFRQFIKSDGTPDLEAITNSVVASQTLKIAETFTLQMRSARAAMLIPSSKELEKTLRQIRKAFIDASRDILDNEDEQHGRKAFDIAFDTAYQQAEAFLTTLTTETITVAENPKTDDLKNIAQAVALEFAKLDGYTIWLRSLEAEEVSEEKHPYHVSDGKLEARSWFASVRVFAHNPNWQNVDGTILGSHDEQGNVRIEYLEWLKAEGKYNEDGTLVDMELLEPTCIEASNFNLSAGRYKPLAPQTANYGNPKEIISQLQEREKNILKGLEFLLTMVEGHE